MRKRQVAFSDDILAFVDVVLSYAISNSFPGLFCPFSSAQKSPRNEAETYNQLSGLALELDVVIVAIATLGEMARCTAQNSSVWTNSWSRNPQFSNLISAGKITSDTWIVICSKCFSMSLLLCVAFEVALLLNSFFFVD